jgi:hypothetical protein
VRTEIWTGWLYHINYHERLDVYPRESCDFQTFVAPLEQLFENHLDCYGGYTHPSNPITCMSVIFTGILVVTLVRALYARSHQI